MAKKLVRANFTQGLFEVQTTNFFFSIPISRYTITQNAPVRREQFPQFPVHCSQSKIRWRFSQMPPGSGSMGGGGGFFTIRSTRPDHPSLSAGYPWGRMACLHLQCWQHHFPWPLPTASVISSDSLPTGFYGASSDFPQRRSAGFHLVTHELGRGD